jgi:hypothetical protein
MHEERHILTLRADLPHRLRDRLLTMVEQVLVDEGAGRLWVDGNVPRDVAVMAELPDASLT